ncbi:MAG: hypothetical protein OXU19_15065 [bacterium]|nr:hypothetical protein [bacterium]MDE0415859.1 hypothetical protein [bacterium]
MIKLDKAFFWTVEAYMRRHEMSPASFGQRSLGDPCFVADLARGRSPSLRTADKVLVFMGFAPLGQAFVDEVEAVLSITGIKSSELGYAATGNPSFVNRLRRGTSPRLTTVDQVRNWIVENSSAEEHRAIRDHCASQAPCRRGMPLPFDHGPFNSLNTRLVH